MFSRDFGSTPNRLADEELMRYVQAGDSRAFEIVFERHVDVAFSLAYRMCGRRAMAEDVVQDAFMSLWRTSGAYDPARGSVRAWVLRVVHNRAVDTFRRAEARSSRDVPDVGITEGMPAAELTDVEVERRGDAHMVRSALEHLPVDQRRVIELAYFGGFSHGEIAAMLELPAGTVKGRMRLGLTKLRTTLGEPAP